MHYFLIVLLHFTFTYILGLIYICCVCTVEIQHSGVYHASLALHSVILVA